MSNKIAAIVSKEGDVILPVTHERAVYDSQGERLNTKIGLIKSMLDKTVESGLYAIDGNYRVGLKYDSNGFDVAKISQHFISLLKEAGIGDSVVKFRETEEDGFFVVDRRSYIGFAVESTGIKPQALNFDFID